jgi:hypothetical protein
MAWAAETEKETCSKETIAKKGTGWTNTYNWTFRRRILIYNYLGKTVSSRYSYGDVGMQAKSQESPKATAAAGIFYQPQSAHK